VNNPTLTEFCFGMIGRADIEGSKSDVAMNAWPPQASSVIPCPGLKPGAHTASRQALPVGDVILSDGRSPYLKPRGIPSVFFLPATHTLASVEPASTPKIHGAANSAADCLYRLNFYHARIIGTSRVLSCWVVPNA
jgi:hypothetical protein